jgi:hypothetical protein
LYAVKVRLFRQQAYAGKLRLRRGISPILSPEDYFGLFFAEIGFPFDSTLDVV